MNYREIHLIYTLFVLVVLIGFIFFTSEYLDTKKENNLLKQALQEEYQRNYIMSTSIIELRDELKEAWKSDLICRNETTKKLYACGVQDGN